MDPLAGVTGVLAHGGTGGLIAEVVIAVGVVALLLAAWVGSRRSDEDYPDPWDEVEASIRDHETDREAP